MFGELVVIDEVVNEGLFFDVEGVWGDDGGVGDIEGLDRALGEETAVPKEGSRDGIERSVGEGSNSVVVGRGDEVVGRWVKLGTVIILRVDKGIVEG